MPALRITRDDKLALALDDLVEVARSTTGLAVRSTDGATITIEFDGTAWDTEVVALDAVSDGDVRRLLAGPGGPLMIVANLISAEARELLAADPRCSWLDRRTGLVVRHGDKTLDVRFPHGGLPGHGRSMPGVQSLASPSADGPIRGRAGIGFAAAMLRWADAPPSGREVARRIGMSPSGVAEAANRLRHVGLIAPDGTAGADLFWELAKVWQPARIEAVRAAPTPSNVDRLDPNLDDLATDGWALGGDVAALAWEAPMFAAGEIPWLWVPSHALARRAERFLHGASWDDRAAVVAVPPTPLVCQDRTRPPTGASDWPTAHPVFLALELAQDPGRGREILAAWNPEGVTRVW